MTITAFRKGIRELKMGDYPKAKEQLMSALGINNRISFAAYADGKTSMSVDKYNAVAKVFASYGVKDCWGK